LTPVVGLVSATVHRPTREAVVQSILTVLELIVACGLFFRNLTN